MSAPMDIDTLKGRTLYSVVVDYASAVITFVCTDGEKFLLQHEQDCCENVWIEDVTGDTSDLFGTPLLVAEARHNVDEGPLPDGDDSFTWTFYELRTVRGSVTIRWFGTSNGYYSEAVEFSEASAHVPGDTSTWDVARDRAISLGQVDASGTPSRADHYRAYFAMGGT